MEVLSKEEAGVAIATMLQDVAEMLVDDPKLVNVVMGKAQESVVLNLTVASDDIGKVIGKGGRTARSLRTILGAVAQKHKLHCDLNILEGEE